MHGQLTNIELTDRNKFLVGPSINCFSEFEQAMGLFFPTPCLKGKHFLFSLFNAFLSFSPHLIFKFAALLGGPKASWEVLRILSDPVRCKILLRWFVFNLPDIVLLDLIVLVEVEEGVLFNCEINKRG